MEFVVGPAGTRIPASVWMPVAVAVLLLALLIWASWRALGSPEPVYENDAKPGSLRWTPGGSTPSSPAQARAP